MNPIAVLTGDLIASTAAQGPAVGQAMQALSAVAGTLGHWVGTDTRFTRFRGDGWQFYLAQPHLALRATLLVMAALRGTGAGLATRLSLAIGPHDTLGTPDSGASDLSAAAGPVFSLSGRNLDALRAQPLAFANPGAATEVWQKAVLDLAHWQARNWSLEQAEAIALALGPGHPTQDQIARSLGITRQAVQARLRGAGLQALQAALAAFETRPA